MMSGGIGDDPAQLERPSLLQKTGRACGPPSWRKIVALDSEGIDLSSRKVVLH